MNVVGLDIGTTTICAVVLDSESGNVVRTVTCENNTQINGDFDYEKVQNPTLIHLSSISEIGRASCRERV